MSPRRPLVLLAVWTAGVVLATGIGLVAVRLVGESVGDGAAPLLSADDVARAASTPPGRTPPATSPTALPAPTRGDPSTTRPPPVPRPPTATSPATQPARVSTVKAFDSVGGSVGARCRGAVPEQVYATPAQGYRLDESSSGGELEVRFEGEGKRVELRIGCRSGSPVLLERKVDEDSSGSG